MYSVDGVPLQNPGMGWKFRGPSKPLSDLTVQRTSLRVPGLPGVVAGVEKTLEALDAPTLMLVVQTPRSAYEDVLALLSAGSVLSITDRPEKQAEYELLTTSYEGHGNADAIIDVTAAVRLPGVFWRDVEETTLATDLTSDSVVADAWRMTGLVTDAVIRVRGTTGLRLISSSAYVEYSPTLTSGSYFRYECATGRAFVTTTDTWIGGTEVSGAVEDDGPGDKFGIYPWRPTPLESIARLRVASTARAAGAKVELRGRGAHLV